MPMGFDWESILGTSGVVLADAYDQAVSTVMRIEPWQSASAV